MLPSLTTIVRAALAAVLLLAVALPCRADDHETTSDPRALVDHPAENVVTRHEVVVDGQRIAYDAEAGTIALPKGDTTEPAAQLFFIAYTAADGDPETRPVTFVFNGGPGSSSVWLHLGRFGPRGVEYADRVGNPGPPPYTVVPNDLSLIDRTDLVFIDPVSTGLSRAVEGESAKPFHSVDGDIASIADFIRIWLGRNERWASPKLLAGESYGTTRAAGLAARLQQSEGIELNGIILVSSILDFQTARFDAGNDLPYVLFLPTYTAIAHYHGALAEPHQSMELRDLLDEVEVFARETYAPALFRGSELDAAAQREVAGLLAAYTGLDEGFIEANNLRVPIFSFTKEMLRDRRRTVGRLDGRFLGRDRTAAGSSPEFDPSYAAIQGNYTGAMNDYLRRELGYDSDLAYEILTGNVRPWSYDRFANRYLNVAERLRGAMSRNPHLRVFVASGYYDLATPYFATDHTIRHLQLEPELRGNVETRYYEAGHMMYIHRPSFEKLRADLVRFYDGL